jgi:hypothetical protein
MQPILVKKVQFKKTHLGVVVSATSKSDLQVEGTVREIDYAYRRITLLGGTVLTATNDVKEYTFLDLLMVPLFLNG